MDPLMNERIEDYFLTLSLLDKEELFISDDDLLLLAESYTDLSKINGDSTEE